MPVTLSVTSSSVACKMADCSASQAVQRKKPSRLLSSRSSRWSETTRARLVSKSCTPPTVLWSWRSVAQKVWFCATRSSALVLQEKTFFQGDYSYVPEDLLCSLFSSCGKYICIIKISSKNCNAIVCLVIHMIWRESLFCVLYNLNLLFPG